MSDRKAIYESIIRGDAIEPSILEELRNSEDSRDRHYAGIAERIVSEKRLSAISKEIALIIERENLNKGQYDRVLKMLNARIVDTPLVFGPWYSAR